MNLLPPPPDDDAFDAWLRASLQADAPGDDGFTARACAALPPRRSPWPEALILGGATAAGMLIAAWSLPPDLIAALSMHRASPAVDSLLSLAVPPFALAWAVLAVVLGRR